jgi:hypothetical protein
MQIEVGQRAQRTRAVQPRDIELFTNQDGTVVLDGEALVWTERL